MAAWIVYFSDEAEANHVIQQLNLETPLHTVSFLALSDFAAETFDPSASLHPMLESYGFSGEQHAACLSALTAGKTAVMVECSDAADLLLALQNCGIREYCMA